MTDDLAARRQALLQHRLRSKAKPAPTTPEIAPAPRDRSLLTSFGQARMWLLDQLQPGSLEYLMPLALELRGPLDIAALQRALDTLVARHEILRTHYAAGDGAPHQIIAPAAPVALTVRDASEPELRAALDAEGRTPFDLARGPLLRAALFRRGDADHVLLITLHHIASDGWSLDVLARELGMLYTAFTAGQPSPLPALALQYADFAAWQRQWLTDDVLARQLTYWRTQLAGLEPLSLPTDRPRPPIYDPAGASVLFTIEPAIASALAALGRSHGATPFMVLLAAFQLLLARYAGQTDIAVGTPIAGRTRVELEPLLGFFVNTLVLRTRVDDHLSFVDLLARVRDTALAAYTHQDVPFERLVDDLQLQRDLSRNPLFQVVFALQNTAPLELQLAGLDARPRPIDWRTAKFDLSLQLVERPDGSLHAELELATALFDVATIERMAGHYRQLLAGIVAAPTARVDQLAWVTPDEQARLLPAPGAARLGRAPATPCLHQLFERQAVATPDAIAVVSGAHTLTYAELNARANRLAHLLRARGVGPDDLVAVCLERSHQVVVALLAILKAGGAYLPLDPGYPAERLALMLDDARPRCLISEQGLVDTVAPLGACVWIDRPGEVADQPAGDPVSITRADNLAYVIYTSGSTGRPKGVMIPHGNLFALFASTARDFAFDHRDVWTFFHSYAFDFSVWEIWGALLHGGRVVVVPLEVSRSPSDLLALLVDQGVTILNQTPSAFRGLAALAAQGDPRFDRMAVRAIVFGGEALELGALAGWFERFGDTWPRLVNMYGITETTVHVTHRPIAQRDLAGASRSPIGVALAKDRLYLLDPQLRPVAIGVPGEIFVGGDSLARGYLHQPALTAARLLPDPFADAPGERMYRTGDQARWLASGELEFLGRLDHQVKIRGFRIELGEIQAQLGAHPAVAEALVTAQRGDDGEPYLLAYVVPRPGHDVATTELHRFLGARLPAYMVPAAFLSLPALPQTANGKLDRKALPVPDGARPRVATGYVAPRTPREAQCAVAWSAALGVDDVGVHDNFFELGGDSIRAVRVVGALREAGHDVSVQQLFQHPTIAALCALETGAATRATPVAAFALIDPADRARLPDDVEDAYPVSMIQAGMIYELLADPSLNLYHNVTRYQIRDDGAFSLAALDQAVQQLLAHHPILRTSFAFEAPHAGAAYHQPLQLVHRAVQLPIVCDDLRTLAPDARRRAVEDAMREERRRPLALDRAPLLRFHVLRDADDSWWLLLVEMHAILDGWSHNSLLAELIDRYRAARDGRPATERAAPHVRFADFVALEQRVLHDDAQRTFWAARVQQHERLALPEAWRDPAPSAPFYDIHVPLADLQPGLRALAKAAGVPLKSVLLAAHLKVMGAITGQAKFLAGLVVNGRPEVVDGDRVLGMFLNTVPFAATATAATWRALAQAAFAEEIALWPHRRFPLPAMQAAWGRATPLVEVIFNYLNFHVLAEHTQFLGDSVDDSPNELALHVSTEPGVLLLTARASRIARRHGEQLGAMYRHTLAAMAADPDGDARQSALPAALRQALIAEGSTRAAPPRDGSVLDALEAHARATPHATAVISGDRRLRYAELVARVHALAARIRARAAGGVVGVCLERGDELVVALLAVLAAGAAYVPLDPGLPAERLGYMLDDAGAQLVVTTHAVLDRAPSALAAYPRLVLDGPDDGLADPARRAPHPDELAYVIYTSGSTGRPKGVMVSHRALANLLASVAVHPGLAAHDVLLAVTTVSFDIAALELFAPLLVGASLVIADRLHATDPHLLADLVASSRASVLQATPTTWRLLFDAGFQPPPDFTILCGGEKLPPDLAARLCASGARVWDLYGPTETTVWSSVTRLHELPPPDGAAAPRFTPVDHTALHVLDAQLEPAPLGVPGELYIGGLGLARGYHRRPDLTADRFIPDPFLHGHRLYRTGDLARRLPDGAIDILGRTDHQLKLRGFRIEPGEIEAALATLPGVAAALVLASPTTLGDTQLTAYVVAPAHPPAPADLRAALAARLPDYMIPAAFVVLPAFPLTPNGKVDRSALPRPDDARALSQADYVAPRTPTEARIAALWADVLGLPRVGVHDDFFALGGHSLLLLRIVHQARTRHGLALSFRDVIDHRTVAAVVAALATTPAAPRAMIRFAPTSDAPTVFCVHPGGGSGHWFLELAQAVAPHAQIAAFEWPGLNHHDIAPDSVARIAALYLDELRAAQSRGPYRLLGWCGGSAIAWEMARCLSAEGAHVALFLLDPAVDVFARDNLLAELQLFCRCEELLERLAGPASEADAAAWQREVLHILGRVIDDGRGATAAELGGEWRHRVKVWRELLQAMIDYRFAPYRPADGTVQLVLGDDVHDGVHEVIDGMTYAQYVHRWSELAGGALTVQRAPGGHFSILKPPHVASLARLLIERQE